jgi:hypothetical protein
VFVSLSQSFHGQSDYVMIVARVRYIVYPDVHRDENTNIGPSLSSFKPNCVFISLKTNSIGSEASLSGSTSSYAFTY